MCLLLKGGETVTEQLPDEMLEALERLSGVLLSEESLDAVLNLVVQQAEATIPAADAVSVSIVRDGRVQTAAYSDDLAMEADEVQYSNDDGPCVDAIRSGSINSVPSMRAEQRWPPYVVGAMAKGVGSSLSLPLMVRDDVIGALNMYARREGAFQNGENHIATKFANQASILLANAVAYMTKDQLADQLQEALKSREAIGKAIGILMEREGIGEEDAFGMLRSASQHSNIKLREIASEVVGRGSSRNREPKSDEN